jgi:hypothetical protein
MLKELVFIRLANSLLAAAYVRGRRRGAVMDRLTAERRHRSSGGAVASVAAPMPAAISGRIPMRT